MYSGTISSELGLLHILIHLLFFSMYLTPHMLCLEIKPLSVYMRKLVAGNYYTTISILILMIQFV